ncbi:hypothetical protein ACQR1W_30990 [Bradyrhizobium sp. HKCCYLS1011]|uniref:hypothetical protein n=1 Tax=Bradyrhizobium sp. HKCCYLS1011 TaxID=3420733 RepID=UPI003EB9611A
MLSRLLNRISSSVSGIFIRKGEVVRVVSAPDLAVEFADLGRSEQAANPAASARAPSRSRKHRESTTAGVSPVAVKTAHVVSQPIHNKARRVRRTKQELDLGLTVEQAIKFRSAEFALVAGQKQNATPVVVKKEGKRFRRTAREIELGLTKEQAMAMRQGVAEPAPKQYVERPPATPEKPVDEQLEDMLSPQTRARARAVSRYRAGGARGPITPEVMSAIDSFIAKKGVTKCPPCTDSDGYNHLSGKETV